MNFWRRLLEALREGRVAFVRSWKGLPQALPPAEVRDAPKGYPLIPAQGYCVVWIETGAYRKLETASGSTARDQFITCKRNRQRVDFWRNGSPDDHWPR